MDKTVGIESKKKSTSSKSEKRISLNPRFVSIPTLACYLGMTTGTIKNWAESGKIPYYKICGSRRFDICEIEEWLKQFKRIGMIKAE